MCNIDQKASDALLKIERNELELLTATDRLFWATFLISLMQRHPQQIARLKTDARAVMYKKALEFHDSYQRVRKPDDPATFSEWMRQAEDTGFFDTNSTMAIQHAITLPQTTSIICDFHWGVCTFAEDSHRLLTSDRPVIISNGFNLPNAYIALPIGPKKLFFASRLNELGRNLCSMRGLAETSNDEIVRQAIEYVYGADDGQLLFVENRLRKRLQE